MTRLRAGDARALEQLYDRHTPLLFAVALRILGSASDAEDVLQELWLHVWQQAERYSSGRGSVAAWLLTLTRSRALDRRRRTAARARAEDRHGTATAASRDFSALDPSDDAGELRRQVRRALATLDSKQRSSLEIAYFEGLTQSEIAERLAVPLGTVKTWMRRGLLHLRTLLEEAYHG